MKSENAPYTQHSEGEPEIVGWLEHHKGGDNIVWDRVDHTYAQATPLIRKSDYDQLRAQLEETSRHLDNEIENANEYGRRAEAAESALREATNKALEWIPCSERLPEATGRFLVAFAPSYSVRMAIAHYLGSAKWQYNGITHWMPLPQPPLKTPPVEGKDFAMKNTTGLYKHQRDNKGKRRKLPHGESKAKLVPVTRYSYEIARDADREMFGDDASRFGLTDIGNKGRVEGME